MHGGCSTESHPSVSIGPPRRRAEIVAGGVDGTVRRFDVRMGMELGDSLGAPVTCVAVSHDGNCLLAACTDGALRLLDKQVTDRSTACSNFSSSDCPAYDDLPHGCRGRPRRPLARSELICESRAGNSKAFYQGAACALE